MMALSSVSHLGDTIKKDLDLDASIETVGAVTKLFAAEFDNTANTTDVYAKVWDKAVGSPPVLGTNFPDWSFHVKAGTKRLVVFGDDGAGIAPDQTFFAACVTGASPTDTTSPENSVRATFKVTA